MKSLIPILGLLTLTLSAHAQTPKAVSISLGVFLPSSGDTRARATNGLPIVDVRYALPAKATAASCTVFGISAAHSSRGEGSTLVSATVGLAYGLTGGSSPLAAQTAYAGFGAGVYGADLNGAHAFARPGAYAEAGYNVTDTLFLNAQYRLVDRAGGATLALDARF